MFHSFHYFGLEFILWKYFRLWIHFKKVDIRLLRVLNFLKLVLISCSLKRFCSFHLSCLIYCHRLLINMSYCPLNIFRIFSVDYISFIILEFGIFFLKVQYNLAVKIFGHRASFMRWFEL